ncbi:MAG: carbohydrate-binding domain-containing protein [Clostridia bacterium]|nr:carbohydrate-binding domain-containing protein [Clostridia bacterium]
MKKSHAILFALALTAAMLSGCGNSGSAPDNTLDTPQENPAQSIHIVLSDSGVTVDGQAATGDSASAVYTANDIVYYEDGHDFTYGEGTESDAHSAEEAAAHTVVHITKPGRYEISGTLSRGQIAVDLGSDADEDPEAVVTLVLNGTDITCTVAPAIIFYKVYECGTADADAASKDVDTSAAGANIIIADGSENTLNGSYVARIYKPDSVVLSDDGSEVEDAKKLHKYDAALYSKMSMNIDGGSGVLNINAANEGLGTELHLTLNGGNINIVSGNDGINTNEDNVSVTTVNGGSLAIRVDGATGEGDGIDSNGWLVINGGSVYAQACAFSGDAGIDSDMGIHINGGTVVASGNMLDRIGDSGQTFAVFQFAAAQEGGLYSLRNAAGSAVVEREIENSFSYLVISDPALTEGEYSLYSGDTPLAGARSGGMGGGMMPGGQRPAMPEGMTPPEGMEMPEGMTPPEGMEMPEGMTPPEGMEMPEGMAPPESITRPEMGRDPNRSEGEVSPELKSEVFEIFAGENYFSNVSAAP